MSNDKLFLRQYLTATGVQIGLDNGQELRTLGESSNPLSLDWLLSDQPTAPRAANLLEVLHQQPQTIVSPAAAEFRAPVGRQEIWAAGVTYKRSEEARESESNNSTVYTRVYNAARPELFFKSLGHDAVGANDQIGIRYDATWSVPEPELVIVLNARMEVVGFTIGNDVSSRDIEGENPLYLPQAKVYEAACAVGPRIWLQPGATVWPQLKIELQIEREGKTVFSGETSTASIHRTLSDLVEYLGRCKRFPNGAFLFTGTGIVPPDNFTLQAGDVTRIRIDPIGELVNTVRVIGKR
ncbi:MAG: fumarylacetoacetate hydrolase family protein [Anaerolineae bacterium]|nr:fumarylacetoacetate hydrolase family protein [Anaerolineae bacterium]